MKARKFPAPIKDYQRHQVQSLYGLHAPERLAEMQRFCDEYGLTPRLLP